MLSDQPDNLGRRNEVVDATEDGLELQIDGHAVTAAWSAVTGVSGGRAKLDRKSGIWILVLAVEVETENRERLFIVGETERAWLPRTSILHIALPGIEPFETWGPSLLTASAPLEIYARHP